MRPDGLFSTRHPVTSDVDISSVEFWSRSFDDRDRSFARLRAADPVSWHPPLETPGLDPRRHGEAGFWAVTRNTDITHVSRHADDFSSAMGQVSLRPAPFDIHTNLLVMDDPAHAAMRRVVGTAFGPRQVARQEHRMTLRARSIVQRAQAAGDFDFVTEVAARLPLRGIADLLGLPPSEHERFIAMADALVSAGLPNTPPPGMDLEQVSQLQATYLRAVAIALAALKRTQPGDDLMTRLVQASFDGRRMDDDDIVSTVMLLVAAGDDTVKQTASLAVVALAARRDQLAWLAADLEGRIDGAVQELVRWASPIVAFARTASRDTELGGVPIARGDKIALFYCSGNRDEAVFADPGRLDLSRTANGHVGFGGGGIHYCLGGAMAAAELRAILRAVVPVLPDWDVGDVDEIPGDFIHGVARLPVHVARSRAGE
jgi:cytochrome P450